MKAAVQKLHGGVLLKLFLKISADEFVERNAVKIGKTDAVVYWRQMLAAFVIA